MSVWEYAQAKARLRQEGRNSVNETEILRAISELRTHVEESQARTKRSRRQAQRRKEHEKKVTPADPLYMRPQLRPLKRHPLKGTVF
ncbi:hypothetical protein HAALTHF_06890n [Vreelandella aquamarina]|nr:hypothetical protein HAALTHF_06890n [Halomonas axialensis]